MVDVEIKKILRGENLGWNIAAFLMGGILFGAGMELGRLAVRSSVKTALKVPLDY